MMKPLYNPDDEDTVYDDDEDTVYDEGAHGVATLYIAKL